MRKTFYCSLGVLKSVLGVCCQLVNLTANHALLQLQTLPQLQLWLMLQGTKSMLQFFCCNFFLVYVARNFLILCLQNLADRATCSVFFKKYK
jgi:hypothetical protein